MENDTRIKVLRSLYSMISHYEDGIPLNPQYTNEVNEAIMYCEQLKDLLISIAKVINDGA